MNAWTARTARFALCWAISSPLLGCGGGGSSPEPVACIPVHAIVQIEGDSIAHGTGATDLAFTPPGLLRAAGFTVVDTALPGSTSADRISGDVIRGQGTRFQPFPQGIVGNVYLTEWGVNNALYGMSVEAFKADLRKIASVPGAILMTPTPMADIDDSAYAQAVRDIGAELRVTVVDVNAYVLSLPNWRVLLVDGVHPSDALYRMVYAQVAPVVRAKVNELECR